MELEYTYRKDGKWYVGCLNMFPEHWTQGRTLNELEFMLADLYECCNDDLRENGGEKITTYEE
jgi:predicted RNase H-like HicB family nuclease